MTSFNDLLERLEMCRKIAPPVIAVLSAILMLGVTIYLETRINDVKRKINAERNSAQALKVRTLELVAQIREFRLSRMEGSNEINNDFRSADFPNEQARGAAWSRMVTRSTNYHNKMINDYEVRFMANAISCRDSLRALLHDTSQPSESSRDAIYNEPVNYFGLKDISDHLERLALQIKD